MGRGRTSAVRCCSRSYLCLPSLALHGQGRHGERGIVLAGALVAEAEFIDDGRGGVRQLAGSADGLGPGPPEDPLVRERGCDHVCCQTSRRVARRGSKCAAGVLCRGYTGRWILGLDPDAAPPAPTKVSISDLLDAIRVAIAAISDAVEADFAPPPPFPPGASQQREQEKDAREGASQAARDTFGRRGPPPAVTGIRCSPWSPTPTTTISRPRPRSSASPACTGPGAA
jgi:hypothetical protein